jgi:hypothetical protein
MIHSALVPVKLLGWAATGLALGVGWKVGGYLADLALDKDKRAEFLKCFSCEEEAPPEPLWKRKFTPVSEG